jgi:hypothetical protein
MSLKAGGVGINLTAASNAFVMVCTMLNFLLSKLWQDFSLNLHFHMPMYNLTQN